MIPIELIDSFSINDFQWPSSESSKLAFYLMKKHVSAEAGYYIENSKHEVILASIANKIIPLVINNGNSSTCYLTSPYTNYISYAKDFICSLRNLRLKFFLFVFLKIITGIIRKKNLDKVIYINHWLIATGPQLELCKEEIESLLFVLKRKFKDYTFVFKGVRQADVKKYAAVDLIPIFNRQIYLWDPKNNESLRIRNFRNDRKLLNKKLILFEVTTNAQLQTVEHLHELYNKLYVDKYSTHNCFYSLKWFVQLLNNKAMTVYSAKLDNHIVFFAACFIYKNELIASVIGHDSNISEQYKIYRQWTSYLMLLAEKNNKVLNLSSGSGKFKLNRGCKRESEYELIYFKHLPLHRKISWWLISLIYNTIGKKIFLALDI